MHKIAEMTKRKALRTKKIRRDVLPNIEFSYPRALNDALDLDFNLPKDFTWIEILKFEFRILSLLLKKAI